MADWNTVLDDSDIDVDVANNMVTLNGTVKSAAAKAKAVSIAKATDGVKGVSRQPQGCRRHALRPRLRFIPGRLSQSADRE